MLVVIIIVIVCVPLVWLVVKANAKYWEAHRKLWEPHCAAFNGKVVKRYRWSGTCDGLPLQWRLRSLGGGSEAAPKETYYFETVLQYPAGGRKWQVHYNVPGLLNHRPEGWTISSKDPDLESALAAGGAKEIVSGLPRYFSARYNNRTGRLTCEYQVNGLGYVAPLEEFTGFVRALQRLGGIGETWKSTHP